MYFLNQHSKYKCYHVGMGLGNILNIKRRTYTGKSWEYWFDFQEANVPCFTVLVQEGTGPQGCPPPPSPHGIFLFTLSLACTVENSLNPLHFLQFWKYFHIQYLTGSPNPPVRKVKQAIISILWMRTGLGDLICFRIYTRIAGAWDPSSDLGPELDPLPLHW